MRASCGRIFVRVPWWSLAAMALRERAMALRCREGDCCRGGGPCGAVRGETTEFGVSVDPRGCEFDFEEALW